MSDAEAAAGNTWATFMKSARRSKGWTIEDLATAAEVSRMTIIRWEQGQTGFKHETVERVARALGVPVDAALAAARGDEAADPLPPPLPRELARLVDIYSEMTDADRRLLLERVGWVNEWAEIRVLRYGDQPARRNGHAG